MLLSARRCRRQPVHPCGRPLQGELRDGFVPTAKIDVEIRAQVARAKRIRKRTDVSCAKLAFRFPVNQIASERILEDFAACDLVAPSLVPAQST